MIVSVLRFVLRIETLKIGGLFQADLVINAGKYPQSSDMSCVALISVHQALRYLLKAISMRMYAVDREI